MGWINSVHDQTLDRGKVYEEGWKSSNDRRAYAMLATSLATVTSHTLTEASQDPEYSSCGRWGSEDRDHTHPCTVGGVTVSSAAKSAYIGFISLLSVSSSIVYTYTSTHGNFSLNVSL